MNETATKSALSTAALSVLIAVIADNVLGKVLGVNGKLFVGLLYLACIFAVSLSDRCQDSKLYGLALLVFWSIYIGLLYDGFVSIFDRALAMGCAALTWWGHESLFKE